MPKLLAAQKLIKAIETKTFLKNAKIENAEGVKYDFSMSSKLLKSEFGQQIDINQLSEQERANLFVEPGEVVFVLTEEILELPMNIKADLSPKRKLSHDGILTLGGFCIDPLYKGRLLVGLYNFSSSPFPLRPGKKLVAALFYELREDEIQEFEKPEIEMYDFPDDLVRLIKKYHPVSTQSILEQFKNLEFKFEEMRKDFREKEDWFKKFQGSLEGHDKNISKILQTLEKEVEDRRDADQRLHDTIQTYSRDAYKTAAIVGTVGALIISLLFFAIQKLLMSLTTAPTP